jgi:hypothetical protein
MANHPNIHITGNTAYTFVTSPDDHTDMRKLIIP